MKKLCLTSLLFVSLLSFSIVIQGQNDQKQFDQLKLMDQFLGTWQMTTGGDTLIAEFQKNGKAFVENDYSVKNGVKNWGSIWTYGFSPDEGKFKIFAVQSTGDYLTLIASFTSERKWVQEIVQDFNPEKVIMKGEFVFESSETATATSFNSEGVKTEEYKFLKIKQE
ncbi:MAG TPA: hypothetical protein DCZ51_03400 [Bacteroidales bacterium]|nr:hypothetical protein [Bacteroidales bacterium]